MFLLTGRFYLSKYFCLTGVNLLRLVESLTLRRRVLQAFSDKDDPQCATYSYILTVLHPFLPIKDCKCYTNTTSPTSSSFYSQSWDIYLPWRHCIRKVHPTYITLKFVFFVITKVNLGEVSVPKVSSKVCVRLILALRSTLHVFRENSCFCPRKNVLFIKFLLALKW